MADFGVGCEVSPSDIIRRQGLPAAGDILTLAVTDWDEQGSYVFDE